jgi:Histone H1-like protein Hc1
MSIKETYKHLKDLLCNITSDIEKSENGNKAASQRVRTGTVKLEKIAKLFRKESIAVEKKTKGQKKPSKSAGVKKTKAKAAAAAAKAKSPKVKVAVKAKAKQAHAKSR